VKVVGCVCVHTVGATLLGLRVSIHRVGQNHTCIHMYGVHTIFLAGKSP